MGGVRRQEGDRRGETYASRTEGSGGLTDWDDEALEKELRLGSEFLDYMLIREGLQVQPDAGELPLDTLCHYIGFGLSIEERKFGLDGKGGGSPNKRRFF